MHNVRILLLFREFFLKVFFLFLAMKNIIFSTLNKTTTTTISNRRSIFKRHRNHTSTNEHTKAHFTPIIELKPILGGSTTNNEESVRKITKIISTNTAQKDAQRINTIVCFKHSPLKLYSYPFFFLII